MAEKKLTKKFGQKRDFKSEEKKTKNQRNHFVRYMENVVDVSFWICHMRSS